MKKLTVISAAILTLVAAAVIAAVALVDPLWWIGEPASKEVIDLINQANENGICWGGEIE